ncbi:apolipoprotein N-acyltransferase [uncultured Cellulomonas sp.]|uniref:apolipoprotein N-acyltransferase n=1 Tax=uncultured Cellulomonas sp. TaxID=189682 RepID=UPI00260F06C1|nr:apolipoprotein N-acyltransferase [uncultured Cellulomonas sp.]
MDRHQPVELVRATAPATSPTATTGSTAHDGGVRAPAAPSARARVRASRRGHPPRPWTLGLAVAGGLLTDTAFPGRSWWPMAYVGIAMLVVALRRDSARWGFLVGLAWGLGFFLPHLWWADGAVGQPIGWVALSVAQAAAVGLLGAAWVWGRRVPPVRRSPWLGALAFAVLWVAVEQLRARVPFGGFPWGRLAFSQTDAPLLALAPFGGTTLVSGAVAVVGALLATALGDVGRRRAAGAVAVAAVVALGPALVPLPTRAEAGTLRVGAVQGNVPARGAEAMSQARAVAQNHADGTAALLDRVDPGDLDLVLWPESASDVDPRTDDDVRAVVDGAAEAIGAPVLLGTQRFFPEVRFNDYILWQAGEGSAAAYTKQHPVPFGEYVPYRDVFRAITPLVDLIGRDMAAGTEVALLPVPVERLGRPVPLTTAICFEVVYDDLIRESVVAGGELVVIPTNNASFGLTQESTQQLAMSRFRAAEHGRAVVQISTVGVSGMVAPDGEVLDRTGLFTAEQMVQELPLRTSLTVADRLGGWPATVVDAAALALLAAGLWAGRRRGRGLTR